MSVDARPFHPVLSPQTPGCHSLVFAVNLPTTVNLRFTGKNQGHDTVLDQNGQIVQDLCVKIKNFYIGQIPIDWFVLNKIMRFISESQQEFYTNYVGFNGELILQLDHSNVFDQIMAWRRMHL